MLAKLKQNSPYDALTDDELDALISFGTTRKYKKNTLIIHQGDETDSLYIVEAGKMKVFIEDESGRELILKILLEGDSFGELALFGGFARSANVQALTDSSALVISKGSFMDYLQRNPHISLEMMKALADMVRETTDELGTIALSDVYGRLVHILEKYAFQQDDMTLVPRFTHREIASMIGSSREMVSKILKDLENGEYILLGDKHYVLAKKLPAHW